jgi:hypothetical protein
VNDDDKEPSHAKPAYFYGDPLLAIIREEAGTCTGCVREATILGTVYCTKGKRHGRRCEHYVERIGVARAR